MGSLGRTVKTGRACWPTLKKPGSWKIWENFSKSRRTLLREPVCWLGVGAGVVNRALGWKKKKNEKFSKCWIFSKSQHISTVGSLGRPVKTGCAYWPVLKAVDLAEKENECVFYYRKPMTCDETVSGEQALVGSSESKKIFTVQRSMTVNQAEKSVEVAQTKKWRNFSKSTFLQLMRSSILLFPSIESCSLEKFLEKFFQVPTHFDGGSLGRRA